MAGKPMSTAAGTPLIRLRGVTKVYGSGAGERCRR